MLLTLEEFKAFKDINVADITYDTHFNTLINAASSFVKRYCGRLLESDSVTEKFNATESEYIVKEYPLTGITNVEVTTDGINFDQLIVNEDYLVDLEGERIIAVNGTFIQNPTFPDISGRVTYTAGFVQIPEDLKLAVTHLVEYYLESEYKPSKAFQGVSVENPGPALRNNLPHHIKRVLDQYRAL